MKHKVHLHAQCRTHTTPAPKLCARHMTIHTNVHKCARRHPLDCALPYRHTLSPAQKCAHMHALCDHDVHRPRSCARWLSLRGRGCMQTSSPSRTGASWRCVGLAGLRCQSPLWLWVFSVDGLVCLWRGPAVRPLQAYGQATVGMVRPLRAYGQATVGMVRPLRAYGQATAGVWSDHCRHMVRPLLAWSDHCRRMVRPLWAWSDHCRHGQPAAGSGNPRCCQPGTVLVARQGQTASQGGKATRHKLCGPREAKAREGHLGHRHGSVDTRRCKARPDNPDSPPSGAALLLILPAAGPALSQLACARCRPLHATPASLQFMQEQVKGRV